MLSVYKVHLHLYTVPVPMPVPAPVPVLMLVIVLESVGIPLEGIAVILGVDRLLDMCRTCANVTGDCMVSCVVASTEGEIELPAAA